MFRLINRVLGKLVGLVHKRGYSIHFEGLDNTPDFEEYHLKDLGKWLHKGSYWICLSKLTEEEFEKAFFEQTNLPRSKVTIKDASYPMLWY